MEPSKDPEAPPVLEHWRKVFKALVEIVQTQQAQLESTVKDRKFLEDRLRRQYEKWVSDVRLLEDQINQMKRDFQTQSFIGALEAAKANMVLGFKQRECLTYAGQLDNAVDELADFRLWFDYFCHKGSNAEDKSLGKEKKKKQKFGQGKDGFAESPKEEECSSERLEDVLERLKQEHQKLSLEKSEEISALRSEVDFVWNQYKTMENSYTEQLSSKTADLKQAMEKVESLISSMEQLECLTSEKDETIATLKAEAKEKDEKITKISKELEMLKAEAKTLRPATPLLKPCTTTSKNSTLGGKASGLGRMVVHVKKQGGSVPTNEKDSRKGSRGTKRKDDSILSGTPPKLFSDSFTFPKLRRRCLV